MAAVTAYGKFFEIVDEMPSQMEAWVSDLRMNELYQETTGIIQSGKRLTLNFGPGKDSIEVEIGNFKQDSGVVSYTKVIKAGKYTAPQTGFSRGRAATHRIL